MPTKTKSLIVFIADIFNDDFKVITVEDGQAALNSLKKSFPDLIISDVMMPKLDGFELLKHIKEDESTSHIPTILLTAKAADQSKIEGLTYGANDYLTKPFSADELKLRVRNQLALVEAVHRQYNTVIQNDEELSNSSFEHPFVRHAAETVVKFIDDSEFDVDRFCYEVGVSRSNLHRKLKSLTGQSTTDFIRQIRLKKAKELLLEYNETVSSVAIQVGFNSLSYFNRQFKRLYQINPSDYRKRNHHL
jgi:YesN/AraC family two-component response regulator